MDIGDAIRAIQQRWLRNWPTMSAAVIGTPVPFAFDNVVKAETNYFARLEVNHQDTEQWTLGSHGDRLYQCTGMIDVRLSGPINEGRGKLDDLAKKVIALYNGTRLAAGTGEHGLTTYASHPNELRRDKQAPQSWILSVVTPFDYYDKR